MGKHITASHLYNFIQCPHRVWRDFNGPQEEKSKEINEFVQLLWDRGAAHEKEVIYKLAKEKNVYEIKASTHEEGFRQTLEAMKRGEEYIYQGVIMNDLLFGIPDLLKRMPNGTYRAVDIKSGRGYEGTSDEIEENKKYKKHYAVQLALYTDLLIELGFCKEKRASIIDIHQKETIYDFEEVQGPRTPETWWQLYERTKKYVSFLVKDLERNKPAMAGICKLCPWYESCKKWCQENKDLSTIFYLGRSNRDRLNEDIFVSTPEELIDLNVEEVMEQKKQEKKSGNKDFLYRVAATTLDKYIKRAQILYVDKKPRIYEYIEFPKVNYELYFDIEDDPTQEFVYLHGVYEKSPNGERFLDFTAREITEEAEKEAWKSFWDYIRSLPENDYAVYYYSHHEKTTYRKMQELYPDVISAEEIETFFSGANVIDLYKIVNSSTDWPLTSYSIKAIATYLGFSWRDKTPSGALSIQWFNEYIETKDEKILKRILEYNEDDCIATKVVKEGIEKLSNNL